MFNTGRRLLLLLYNRPNYEVPLDPIPCHSCRNWELVFRDNYLKHMANLLIKDLVNEETYNTVVGYIYDYSREVQDENNCDYRKTLSDILDGYVELVRNNSYDTLFFAEVVANVYMLNRVVTSCYQGKRSTAYIQLKNLLKRYEKESIFVEIPTDAIYYRMRVCDLRKEIKRKELFHIPFEKIRQIKTQRYSSPGYPCLYLGESLYGCWEEMQRPDTESTLFSVFKTTRPFKVVDMRIPTLQDYLANAEFYLKFFPIIIASTIPVINGNDIFKPEYLLPQMILEWVIDKRKEINAIGVYYTSAFKNGEFYKLDHEWDNLVLPVQKTSDKGICKELASYFTMTKPTCYEYEFMQGNINNTAVWDDGPKRKSEDKEKNNYYWSLFSRLEEKMENAVFASPDA